MIETSCKGKLIALLVTAFIMMNAVTALPLMVFSAPASEGTVSCVCDDETRTVIISGVIPSKQIDRKIMLIVVNPNKTVTTIDDVTEETTAYIAQTITNGGGQFAFDEFVLDEDAVTGSYQVRIGAAIGDEVLTADFHYTNIPLKITEILQEVNGTNSATELQTLLLITYKDVIKLEFTQEYDSINNKLQIFEKMTLKSDYKSLKDIRDEFVKRTDEQWTTEYNSGIVDEINSASPEDIAEKLLEYNHILQLPLDDETDEISRDYNEKDSSGEFKNMAAVHQLMANKNFTRIDDIREYFYRALLLSLINSLEYGEQFKMVDILQRYSLHLEIADDYLNYSDKSEANKLVIGKDFSDITELNEALSEAVLSIEKEKSQKAPLPSPGGSGGGSFGSSIVYSTAESIQKIDTKEPDTTESNTDVFQDIQSDYWAKDSIYKLMLMGVIEGINENEFLPERNVYREEFITMLMRAFKLEVLEEECVFSDVEKGVWYYNYIATAAKINIIHGIDSQLFGVNTEITRQDMAVMCYRLLQYLNKSLSEENDEVEFVDNQQISDYAAECIQAMQRAGIITGMPGNRFAPEEFATRAQAAEIINRLL